MFRQEKVFVGTEVQDREALCRRLTDNGATLVAAAGDPDVLHILNTFEGGIFDDCVKRSCRVLGVPIVQETLRTGKALPRSSHPVYSRVMEGLVVAGEVEEKAKLKNYVHYMNGIWVDEIGVGTNYFVTNEPGSLHYLWALELGTNIVQPSWISESWENQALPDVKAHLLPPLSGCVISVTGLSSATRTSIQHLVTHYGGKYTQQLSRRVTHLLCDKPKGRKYMTALTWGIHIVTTNWLFDSINAKGTVDVTRYELPSLPSVDMDGGEGGYYMRSSLRSGPYNPLTSTTRRGLNYTAPILVRRHRTSVASNYAPMFSLPPPPTHSQHMHPLSSHQQPVFAQTTQIQSGPSSMLPPSRQPSSMLSQQTFSPPKTTSSSRSSRDKDVRTNMDRYRDLFDQLTGMLRMCDEVIERCTNQPLNPITNNNTNNNNINSTLNTNNNNTSTNNNTNTININNNNNSNRDTITNTTETAITTTTSTEPSIPPPPDPPSDVPSDQPSDPSTNLSTETINTSADPSSSSPSTTSTTTSTSTTEDNADIDMESDSEEVATTVETSTASSEQEK